MARNFIQESIDSLNEAAVEIDKIWKQFQAGKIDKTKFEDRYTTVLSEWLSSLRNEAHIPNNGCKYNETCPTSDFFKREGI